MFGCVDGAGRGGRCGTAGGSGEGGDGDGVGGDGEGDGFGGTVWHFTNAFFAPLPQATPSISFTWLST